MAEDNNVRREGEERVEVENDTALTEISRKSNRLCEVLGVEVGEEFSIRGAGKIKFHIDISGAYITRPPCNCELMACSILDAINHPELILKCANREDCDELDG